MRFNLEAHRPELDALMARGEGKGRRPDPGAAPGPGTLRLPPRELQDYIAQGLGVPQSTVYGVSHLLRLLHHQTPRPASRQPVPWNRLLRSEATPNLDRLARELGGRRGGDDARLALHPGGLPVPGHVQQGACRNGGQDRAPQREAR